jgi:hypothetical protein
MSRRSVDIRPVDTRWPLRAGALALAALMLVTACATGASMGGGLTASHDRPPLRHDSPEPWALESEADAGAQQGEAFFTLHTDVSRLYSSIKYNITGSFGLTAREWLSGQSYEAQRAFGLLAINNVRSGVW